MEKGNTNKNTKKYIIVLTLKILETDTDKKNPITQTKIAEDISRVYPCDRKTVGRNIKYLKEVGYPIIKTKKGFYMDRKIFSLEEINFIKNAIALSPNGSASEKENILKELIPMLVKQYKNFRKL